LFPITFSHSTIAVDWMALLLIREVPDSTLRRYISYSARVFPQSLQANGKTGVYAKQPMTASFDILTNSLFRHTTQPKSVVKLAWLESITKTGWTRPHFVVSLGFLPLLVTDSSWTTILETWRAHEANFFRLSPCLTETTLSSQVSMLLDPLVTQSWFTDVRYKKQRIWHGYKLGECW